MEAIDEAWSEAGVAILVDLGGAETNSEMAIEMLAEPRGAKIVICNAPIVEGAVMAATEASGGASLEDVAAHGRRIVAAVNEREMSRMRASAEATVLITHEVGLHARPSVKFTKLAKTFAADDRDGAAARRPVDSTPRASSR